MPELPKILTRRKICSSRLFHVEAVALRFSNGEEREYEYLSAESVAAVIIVPVTSTGEVLLIREYGIGVEDYEWALPKGRVDEGESYLEAANRELKEEVGYGAKRLHALKSVTQSPNYMQHRTQIVLARDLFPERLEGDEPETLEVKAFSLNDLHDLCARLDFSEARSIAALYLARDYLAKEMPDQGR